MRIAAALAAILLLHACAQPDDIGKSTQAASVPAENAVGDADGARPGNGA